MKPCNQLMYIFITLIFILDGFSASGGSCGPIEPSPEESSKSHNDGRKITTGTPVAVSPDGTMIIVKREYTNYFLCDSSGGNPRKISDTCSSATFSPDSKKLAFVKTVGPIIDSNGVRIYTYLNAIDINTFQVSPLFPRSIEHVIGNIAWSPDGKKISFEFDSAYSSGSYLTLTKIVSSDGTGKIYKQAIGPQLQWAPNGNQFTYSWYSKFFIGSISSTANEEFGIGIPFNPRWLPDGNTIAYISSQEGYDLVYHNVAAHTDQVVAHNMSGYGPMTTISPDGKKAVFARYTDNSEGNKPSYYEIAYYDLSKDTTINIVFIYFGLINFGNTMIWSPNSQDIYYEISGETYKYTLH